MFAKYVCVYEFAARLMADAQKHLAHLTTGAAVSKNPREAPREVSNVV